jgi:hypothetical protein
MLGSFRRLRRQFAARCPWNSLLGKDGTAENTTCDVFHNRKWIGRAGVELLKPAANDVLQRWPVSKTVNSSRASDDDATLIDRLPTDPNVAGVSGLFA